MQFEPSGLPRGASVAVADFCSNLDEWTIRSIRAAWLKHHVLVFPEQSFIDEDLVRVARYYGKLGNEAFFVPLDGGEGV